jgi:hypothetical protein
MQTGPLTVPAGRDEPDRDTRDDRAAWHTALVHGAVAFVLSRIFVLAGAALIAVARAKLKTPPDDDATATAGMLEVLTSWDGKWYFEIVRGGYPRSIPPNITYEQLEARAAFFPLYPTLVRWLDRVLPGGDVAAGIALNAVLGALFVLLVGVLARRMFDAHVARRAMVLAALFPGSFVLSFTYSETVLLVLAALCLLFLLDHRWLLAGLSAGMATLARPNAVALVAACAVASFLAIRKDRDWRSLAAPILAPIGFIAFQLFLGFHTGEQGVWFRVQREAWEEGISLGFTAVRGMVNALAHPVSSPTNMVTLASMVTMILLLWACVKVRLPIPVWTYTLVVLVLMLLPDTVTARPRFLYTAFPLLIGAAAWWPDDDRVDGWAYTLTICGAGLVTVVTLYGGFGAIP